MQFSKSYFSVFLLLLITEVAIALYVHDRFVRPYIGDVLVVILMYCFVKSFLKLPAFTIALAVLSFAFLTEILQYFNIVALLGMQHLAIARTIIGTSFSWEDLLAYIAGFALIVFVERKNLKNKNQY